MNKMKRQQKKQKAHGKHARILQLQGQIDSIVKSLKSLPWRDQLPVSEVEACLEYLDQAWDSMTVLSAKTAELYPNNESTEGTAIPSTNRDIQNPSSNIRNSVPPGNGEFASSMISVEASLRNLPHALRIFRGLLREETCRWWSSKREPEIHKSKTRFDEVEKLILLVSYSLPFE